MASSLLLSNWFLLYFHIHIILRIALEIINLIIVLENSWIWKVNIHVIRIVLERKDYSL